MKNIIKTKGHVTDMRGGYNMNKEMTVKKERRSMIILLATILAICFYINFPVHAAQLKLTGYTISTGNTTVYTSSSFTTKKGTIFGSDEVTILSGNNTYLYVRYPISSNGGTKTGYIRTSAMVVNFSGKIRRATNKIVAYKRNSTNSRYGAVYSGDEVIVFGTKGSFTQLRYPVQGGFKVAFVRTSDANKYLVKKTTNTALQSPVPSGCKFSKKTNDGGWYGFHDINRNVSTSTPVYAIADGTVTYKQAFRTYNGIKKLTSYGNYIEFKSSNGVYTAKYCHLSRFVGGSQFISSSMTVRVSGSTGTYNCGSRSVKKGQIIGYIGTTGNSSGIHLHFELRKNGSRIDPTSVISGLY